MKNEPNWFVSGAKKIAVNVRLLLRWAAEA